MKASIAARTAAVPEMTSAGPSAAPFRPSYKAIVVLPCFNEEANIGRLLEKIDEHLTDSFVTYQVVVVDDGSSDRTAEILDEYSRKFPIFVYRHTVNQGLGATLRDGLSYANQIAEDKDIVITM